MLSDDAEKLNDLLSEYGLGILLQQLAISLREVSENEDLDHDQFDDMTIRSLAIDLENLAEHQGVSDLCVAMDLMED